jgi:hypothetical protein
LEIVQKKRIMLEKRKDPKETVKYWYRRLCGAKMDLSGKTIMIEIKSEHLRIKEEMEGGEIVFTKEKWRLMK